MIIYKKKSNLDPTNVLFDIQSDLVEGKTKFDLVINPQGQINRIIGLDKLLQHALKLTLVKKATYSESSTEAVNIGTSVSAAAGSRSSTAIKREILDSFKTYAKIQYENSTETQSNVIGWDIYRTRTPENLKSWRKINKHLVSNNFFYDSELLSNKIYYYGVVKVRNVNGIPTSDAVGTGLEITIPTTDTQNAVVGDDFIMIPTANAVTLYWSRFIEYNDEELLDKLSALEVSVPLGEPRLLRIYFKIKNKEQTAVESSTGVAGA